MYNIILFGAPGSGKGTQSAILAKNFNLCHISTGDILRNEIAAGSELGEKAKVLINAGKLVPDEIVIPIVEKFILKNKNNCRGVIFDGFPRTIIQAESLDKVLEKSGISIQKAVYLEVTREELIQRINIRSKTSGRSDDNDLSIINSRIKEYNEKTEPVLDYYNKQGKYIKITAIGTIDEINLRICDAIELYNN